MVVIGFRNRESQNSEDLSDSWQAALARSHLARSTKDRYRAVIGSFVAFASTPAGILDKGKVKEYLGMQTAGTAAAPARLKTKIAVKLECSALVWLMKHQGGDKRAVWTDAEDCLAGARNTAKRANRAYSVQDVKKMIQQVSQLDVVAGIAVGAQYDMAARAQDLVKLTAAQVSTAAKTETGDFVIRLERQKTKERNVLISASTHQSLMTLVR